MDYSVIFSVAFFVIALMLFCGVMYIPYKMIQFFIRGMINATRKTLNLFVTHPS